MKTRKSSRLLSPVSLFVLMACFGGNVSAELSTGMVLGATRLPPAAPNTSALPTTAGLPFNLNLAIDFVKENPAFVQKFAPLYNAIQPYLASATSTNGALAENLRYKFFELLLVEFPKLLNSPLTHQIVDAFTARVQQVNLTGIDPNNPASVVKGMAARLRYDMFLKDLYTIAEKFHLYPPAKPSLTTKLESVLVNFTLGTLPMILKNPLLWLTKDLLMKQVTAVNLTGVDTTRFGPVLETIFLKADWDQFLEEFYGVLKKYRLYPMSPSISFTIETTLLNFTLHTIPGILNNPMFQALDYFVMEQVRKMNFTGVDFRDMGLLVRTFLIQLHPEIIISKVNALPGVQNPEKKPVDISKQCVKDIAFMYQGTLEGKSWAISMMDAIGKPGSGILKGNLYMTGNYDECLAATAKIRSGGNNLTRFSGSYCRITVDLPKSFVDGLGVDTHGIPVRLSWGLCVPNTCSDTDIRGTFTSGFMSHFDLTIRDVFCGNDLELSEDGSAITAIVILSLLLGITAVGTLLEVLTQNRKKRTATTDGTNGHVPTRNGVNGHTKKAEYNDGYVPDADKGSYNLNPVIVSGQCETVVENGSNGTTGPPEKQSVTKTRPAQREPRENLCVKMLKSFSVLTNAPKILTAKHPPGSITCLNGIRYLSMAWVILCHTFYYGVFSISDNQTTENMIDASTYIQRFTFMAIAYGTFCVDTFFVLSGLLVAYLFFKDLDKRKGRLTCMKMVVFYVHRFWRLTPIYMIVLMMFTGLQKYVIFGPMYPRDMSNAENCKANWWTNFLYVNNLVNEPDMCMGWTWYLANDMQFYIISPIFILSMYFLPIVGVILTVLLLAGSIVATAVIENRGAGNMLSIKEADPTKPSYYDDIYVTPWCRVGAYCVGLLLAFIMHRRGKKRMSVPVATIGWVIALSLGLFVTYCGYTELQEGAVKWTQPVRSAYEGLSRPVFAACVAWVIYACHTGRGGYINSILSWQGLIPMARLTYAAYLIHPIIMFMYMYRRHSLIYLSDYTMVYFYLGHLCLAYGAAFILSVLFESPFLSLEKIILKLIGN